ncbi:MAG: HEAT repeat domain-containing protein [candidate division NC10 bacterium]|nr:HEAT repeat domain-containing protein [candidate division NC10 bacterium]
MKRKILSLLFLFFLFLIPLSSSDAGELSPGSLGSLLQDLKSPDYQKAWKAAEELGRFPRSKSQIVPALIEALHEEWEHCSGDIRGVLAESLAQMKAKEAVFPLLDLLKSGKNIDHECAECGCCFLPLTPQDELAERFFDPFCENSVLAAIHQLADFSHSKAMADLIAQGSRWRPELLITLGKVGLPRYAHFISRYKDDQKAEVRIAVAQALGMMDNDAITIPVLLQLLSRRDEEFSVRWAADQSLIQIGKRKGNPRLKQQLAGLLKGEDKMTVALAARALAHLGEGKGLLKLRDFTKDAEAKLRFEAMMYLGEVGDVKSRDLFLRGTRDENLMVRAAAIHALGKIGDPSSIPRLQQACDEALRYESVLDGKLKAGTSEKALREQYGYRVYDLRETLQQALEGLQTKASPTKKN